MATAVHVKDIGKTDEVRCSNLEQNDVVVGMQSCVRSVPKSVLSKSKLSPTMCFSFWQTPKSTGILCSFCQLFVMIPHMVD
jgi:hypothetical protein